MVNKINLNLSIPGKNSSESKRPMTLDDAKLLIQNKKYPKDVEEELLKLLVKLPNNTYERFFKNIYIHLKRIQTKSKE